MVCQGAQWTVETGQVREVVSDPLQPGNFEVVISRDAIALSC